MYKKRPPNKTSSSEKKFALFLGITFLVSMVLILSVILFFSKSNILSKTRKTSTVTPTPTVKQIEGWVNYENQELGFSIVYPKGWQTKEISMDSTILGKTKGIMFRPLGSKIINDHFGLITVEVGDNTSNLTIDSFINKYLCNPPDVCPPIEKIETIIISGIQGKEVFYPAELNFLQATVLMTRNKVFSIVVILSRSVDDVYSTAQKQEIYNQMLTSFKLI